MERVRKVILGNNSRSLDLTPVLPPYCIMILASAEDVRPRIHEYRKQLEKGASLFSSSWSKFDSGGLCANCPLWSLMKTQEDLVNAQRKFQDESVKQLIGILKTWEEECSLLLKSKVELHRAFMDMNKVRDKQRSGKDNENVKSLIAFTESTYNLQKETLFKDLSRYLQSESSHQAEIKKFLEEQLKFLDFCRKEADCILSTTSSPSGG